MTRLTNDMRDRICSSAINAAFKVESEALAKEADALGMEMYRATFDEKTRRAVAKVPDGWFRMDGCLRFNCAGWDLTFRVNKDVPVPSRGYGCNRLGNIDGELAERGQAWANKGKDFSERRRQAEIKLKSMLLNISSISSLEKTWPDGKPFYERYLAVKTGAALPAIQVSEINAMLGIAEAAA